MHVEVKMYVLYTLESEPGMRVFLNGVTCLSERMIVSRSGYARYQFQEFFLDETLTGRE